MLKKILCMLIVTVMGVTGLTGCKLVTLDEEFDAKQVVMTVGSYDIIGTDVNGEQQTYTTQSYTVYKGQFISIYNTYAAAYEQYYGMSHEEIVDELFRQLAVEKIVLNLAEAYIQFGYIEMGTYETNNIAKNTYAAIDELIEAYVDEILEENGYVIPEEEESTDTESTTTYPVKETETDAYAGLSRDTLVELCIEAGIFAEPTNDAEQDKLDKYTHAQLKQLLVKKDRENVPAWKPSLNSYPGLYEHDADTRSLKLEAFSRALAEMKTQALTVYGVTEEDEKKIEEDYKKFDQIKNEKGLPYVYEALGDSHVIYLLVRKSYEDSEKLTLLEEYITGTVEVTKAEVEKEYNTKLADQKSSFDANESAYASNIQAYSNNYYFPTDNYFFVKHILIPFSTEQTAALTAYQSSTENLLNGDYEDYRNRLAGEIMSYQHVDGEDYGDAIGIDAIYNEIYSAVNSKNTLRDKERAFDDLIYKYNTDPGIFNTMYGYVELYDLNGASEQYVEEFAAAARELYEGGVEGAISGKIVTDYGVHVMYLTKLPKAGEVLGLYDYLTYAEEQTVYEIIEKEILAKRQEAVFSTWRTEQISRYYYEDGVVTIDMKPIEKDLEEAEASHNH